MKESEFQRLDPLADALDEQCDRWFNSEEFLALNEAIRKASATLPPTYLLSVDVELRVFDTSRERGISLLTAGISTSEGNAPYRTSGNSTPHRYIADGELCELPHDRCPCCWGIWDFKLIHPACPQCGSSLGKEVKLLLDKDICPQCEQGHISTDKPICNRCGFTIDPTFVNWG